MKDDSQYPKWVYKFGEEPKIVQSEGEFEDGWFETPQTEAPQPETSDNKVSKKI